MVPNDNVETLTGSTMCNCHARRCMCTTSIQVTHGRNGAVQVVTIHSNYYDNSYQVPPVELAGPELSYGPFFRLARDPAPTRAPLPLRVPRRQLGAARIDWARLPRRSPRGI